jgi:hypothetical protein
MAPHPQERLLRDVLGQRLVAHHAEREAVNAPLVTPYEGYASPFIADSHTGKERVVARARVSHSSPKHTMRLRKHLQKGLRPFFALDAESPRAARP